MRKGFGALLLLMILVLGVSISQTNPTYLQRDIQRSAEPKTSFLPATQITDYQHYVNETITVSEWIRVMDGGELVIENCTVIFTLDEMSIVADEGGSLTIKDSYLYSFTGCSWWITAEVGSHLHISNSELVGSGTKHHGALSIYTDDASIIDCTITRFGGNIIHIQDCENTLISGNTISQCSWEGINIVGASRTYVFNNSISDTDFCGIYAFGVDNLVIEQNTFENTTYNGIVFVNSFHCVVDNNLFQSTVLDGVGMEYCENMTITNNVILDSASGGIGAIHATVLNISRNYISNAQWDGIALGTFSQYLVIEKNEIANSGGGITLRSSFDALVAGNVIHNMTYNGVCIEQDCERVSVIGNTIINCEIGVFVADHRNMTIIGNLINESFYNDIRLEFSSNVDIYLNGFCSNIRDSGYPIASEIKWHNYTLGNYWYHYPGSDENNDGIGDTMYVIDEGNYDFYPLMTVEPVLDFLEDYIIPTPPLEPETSDLTTTTSPDETPFLNEEQFEVYLLTNSIIQLVGISLLVIVILYRSRFMNN